METLTEPEAESIALPIEPGLRVRGAQSTHGAYQKQRNTIEKEGRADFFANGEIKKNER